MTDIQLKPWAVALQAVLGWRVQGKEDRSIELAVEKCLDCKPGA